MPRVGIFSENDRIHVKIGIKGFLESLNMNLKSDFQNYIILESMRIEKRKY